MVAEQRNHNKQTDIYDLAEPTTVDELWSYIERGSRDVPFLAAAITNAVRFVQKQPFPEVMNRTFTLFKDIFLKTESNLIRYRIIVFARECRPFIQGYQATELMMRMMMQLSHNQDPEARACSLMLLAALAPVMHCESHAHHLILEGLNSPVKNEKLAALNAAIEFAEHSIVFGEIAIEKLSAMIKSEYVDENVKVHALYGMMRFKDSVACCDKINELCTSLFNKNYSRRLIAASYELLTFIAKKRSHVSEHIDFLLNELEYNATNPYFVNSLAMNLYLLPDYTQWAERQVQLLLWFSEILLSQKSVSPTRHFLKCLINLAKEKSFHQIFLKDAGFLTILMAHEDFEVAVYATKLTIQVDSVENNKLGISTLVHLLPSLLSRMNAAPKKLQKMLLKLTVSYCNRLFTEDEHVESIVTHLIAITTLTSTSYLFVLEALNAICNCSPKVYPLAIDFAWNVLNEKVALMNQDVEMGSWEGGELHLQPTPYLNPSNLLISLFLAPNKARGFEAPTVEEFVTNYALKTSYRQQYDIAMLGYRYGHWKTVSLPLLQNLPSGQLSSMAQTWIKSLIGISTANVTEFNTVELTHACFHLSSAVTDLEQLCPNPERLSMFGFPHLYANIFKKITFLMKCFFTFLNGNKLFLSMNTEYSKFNLVTQCDLMSRESVKITPMLYELAKFSFDADEESKKHIVLLQQVHDLVHYGIEYLMAIPHKDLPQHISVSTENIMNARMRDTIAWARSQFAKLERSRWQDRVDYKNVLMVSDVYKELYMTSLYLPRAFFQMIYSTKISLNVKVGSQKKDFSNAFVVSTTNKSLPVDIEGYVDTNNPAGIQFIIVKAVATPERGYGESGQATTYQKSVEMNQDNSRFMVNFGFNLVGGTKLCVKYSVTFIDRIFKKTWQSGATADMVIKIGRQE